MFCRVFYVYRQNDRKTKNDRIYTINKDFNVPQIRYKLSRTTCDTTTTNTVNNEQQDGRGSSVITPLPAGEGSGEGPVVVGGGAALLLGRSRSGLEFVPLVLKLGSLVYHGNPASFIINSQFIPTLYPFYSHLFLTFVHKEHREGW